MMGRKSMWSILAATALLTAPSVTAPSALAAQAQSVHQVQVADIEGMKSKFMSLGAAFPDDAMDWRPMEGVRSVKDVLVLITAEANLFPPGFGTQPPMGAAADFRSEIGRLSAMSRSDLMAEMAKAFDYMIAGVNSLDQAAQMRDANFFGRTMSANAYIATATGDMHEHLGQLIAYARTNEIVPPWSR